MTEYLPLNGRLPLSPLYFKMRTSKLFRLTSSTPLASQLIRKQVGGFIFDVGLLGPCGKHAEEAEDVASMPRTLRNFAMSQEAEDVAKHAQELPSQPTHLRFPHVKITDSQSQCHIGQLQLFKTSLFFFSLFQNTSALCFKQKANIPSITPFNMFNDNKFYNIFCNY